MSSKAHLESLESFAVDALRRYGLADRGWTFRWDHARKRFGSCSFARRQITMSVHLARLNEPDPCHDTILHEIAHALAGREAGHGPVWRAACRRVGARPERCYEAEEVVQPPSKYVRHCPSCQRTSPLYRRSRKRYACGHCCKKHNGGRYSAKYRLVVTERETFERQVEL
jgi:predicted SprT family Zn-dependent metalloprotease